MNAFEYIVSELLHEQGYWTRVGYRLTEVSKEEKAEIGKPSMPRPELDIVAYRPRDRDLVIVECKSYIDSPGVGMHHFDGTSESAAKAFKLFNDGVLQRVVMKRLVEQLVNNGLLPDQAIKPRLGVAAGRIRPKDRDTLPQLFKKRGWQLITPQEIAGMIRARATNGYEDETMTIVAKLLERNP